MFREKTVFILGAGASHEADLPLGAQLAEYISKLLNVERDDAGNYIGEDRDFLLFFLRHGLSEKIALEMSRGISFSNSIDEYIDRHREKDVEKIGKLAIIYGILQHERNSRLRVDPSNIYNTLESVKLRGTWYLDFARSLFRSVPKQQLDHVFGNLAVIDFNYDRCLQHFLRYALRDGYTIDAASADALVETMDYHHPYGSIGPLRTIAAPNGVLFGADPHSIDVEGTTERLKTYTERLNTDEARKIKEAFATAHMLVFLGFGFHEQNMLLLSPEFQCEATRVIATGKSLSEDDRRIIQHSIEEVCNNGIARSDIVVRDLTCSELFKEYRLTLQSA